MKRIRCGTPGRARGFTLVELLVVMGIIVLLVGLLMPAVNAAIAAARTAGTRNIISNLTAGLESFRGDWGIYPPSDNQHDGGVRNYGYYAIAYYLMGPTATGWGSNVAPNSTYYRRSPFGGDASAAYGPYFKPEAGSGVTDYVLDAFKPGKYVFYFRYEPADSSSYDVTDCGTVDSTMVTNFASDTHFQLLAKPKDPTTGNRRWVRPDYLLVSSGTDRLWGYVVEDVTSGTPRAAAEADMSAGVAACDDVCNFER